MDRSEETSAWTRARDIFLDIADASEETRVRVLKELRENEPELCDWVERLLAEDLGEEPEDSAEGTGGPPQVAGSDRIGAFTLIEEIGEGGFGTVYRARQEEPVSREVALKILKPGIDSPQVLARFEDERKYLARIDHPDVVKILDAGTAADGRLFVAMELVRGELITSYVADNELPLDERVTLLVRVARAVHHVHQRAIIHRDLKPSNILVTTVDGAPRPRIIDFGIATAVCESDRSGWTQEAGPMFTPSFASPEQLAGSESIDTRADIYALGVILCELLTGERPRARVTPIETPARTPSTLIADEGPAPITGRNLRGDLDRIILKCVAWEPAERYESASALADDLERYLRHQPVLATPPNRLYLARKFVRRNRLTVAASVVALLAVMVGLVLAIDGRNRAVEQTMLTRAAQQEAEDEADRARAEEERAERSLHDAIQAIDEMLRQGSDEGLATKPGTDPARRQLVLRALELYEDLLAREAGNPVVKRRVIGALSSVARLQREVGDLPAAVEAAEQALEYCAESLESGTLEPDLVAELRGDALFSLAVALFDMDRFEDLRAVASDQMESPLSGDEDHAAIQMMQRVVVTQMLARARQREGDVRGAIDVLEGVIASCSEMIAERPNDRPLIAELAMAIHLNAYYRGFHTDDPNYEEGFIRSHELVVRARELAPEAPWLEHRLAQLLSNWGHVEIKRGHFADALPFVVEADERLLRLCRQFPLRESFVEVYLTNVQRLSWAYRFGGDEARAEEVMQAGIEVGLAASERMPESAAITFLMAMLQSGLAYRVGVRGEYERADALFARGRAAWESLLSRPEPQLDFMLQAGVFYDKIGRYRRLRGDLAEAEELAGKAVEWHDRMLELTGDGEHANRLSKSLPLQALVQFERGRDEAAAATLRRALEDGICDRSTFEGTGYAPLLELDFLQAFFEASPD